MPSTEDLPHDLMVLVTGVGIDKLDDNVHMHVHCILKEQWDEFNSV